MSIIGTLLLAALGIGFYFVLGSEAVLLDGLFTLMGVPTAIVGLYVARVSREAPTEDYPLGFAQARPMLELFKSLFLLGLITLAVISSIDTIMAGGRQIEGTSMVIYGGAAMVACFLFGGMISLLAGKTDNSLVKLERSQWIQDGLLSGAIGIAFGIVAWVDHPSVAFIGPFLDQVLVIALALFFVPLYLRTIASSGKQLLISAPSPKLRDAIRGSVEEVLRTESFASFSVASVYSGGAVLVDVEVRISDNLPDHAEAMDLKHRLETVVGQITHHVEIWLSYFPAGRETSED